MKRTLLAVLSAVFLLTSCGTTRFFSGATKDTFSEGFVLLGPVSSQYYLDRHNQESYNDSLSVVSRELVDRLMDQLDVPMAAKIRLDSLQKEEAVAFMRHVANMDDRKLIATIPIPSLLDSLLESRGERYGLVLYADGMTRDNKGYAKEVAKGALLGVATAILSLGTVSFYNIPIKSGSGIYAAILDAETDHVVFYNASTPEEGNPLRESSVRKQLEAVFKDFLK